MSAAALYGRRRTPWTAVAALSRTGWPGWDLSRRWLVATGDVDVPAAHISTGGDIGGWRRRRRRNFCRWRRDVCWRRRHIYRRAGIGAPSNVNVSAPCVCANVSPAHRGRRDRHQGHRSRSQRHHHPSSRSPQPHDIAHRHLLIATHSWAYAAAETYWAARAYWQWPVNERHMGSRLHRPWSGTALVSTVDQNRCSASLSTGCPTSLGGRTPGTPVEGPSFGPTRLGGEGLQPLGLRRASLVGGGRLRGAAPHPLPAGSRHGRDFSVMTQDSARSEDP